MQKQKQRNETIFLRPPRGGFALLSVSSVVN